VVSTPHAVAREFARDRWTPSMTLTTHSEAQMTPARIIAWMVMVVVLLGAAAYWDERREADAALADFGAGEAKVAAAAAAIVRASLDATPETGVDPRESVAPRLTQLEQPGRIEILLRRPGQKGLETLTGALLRSPPIERAFAHGLGAEPWVRLTHLEAVQLGLPPRTAMAGLVEMDLGAGARWGLVVVATAIRERNREERGLWRVALAFLLASATVVTFGTLALRRQRTELELAQRLAIAEAVQVRDERLVRADKLATLGAMAMGIAHQVATPLGVIVGRSERLVVTDEKSSRAVAAIRKQARRINEIVRAFLRLARGGTPTLVHSSPATLAREAVELVSHRFDKAGVTLRTTMEDHIPAIACDPSLFEQVLVNLLLNACDACSRGGHVTLAVSASLRAVTFAVEDDGVGISAASAQRATEPFFSTKAPEDGTGLGLVIAQEIIGHHHGTLELLPLPEKGTRARVEIPLPATEPTT
jgi:two-component system NtrC family sensor kinase